MIKRTYRNKAECTLILTEMAANGYKLVEDCIHFDGKYLLFSIDWRARLDAAATVTDKIGVIRDFIGMQQ